MKILFSHLKIEAFNVGKYKTILWKPCVFLYLYIFIPSSYIYIYIYIYNKSGKYVENKYMK